MVNYGIHKKSSKLYFSKLKNRTLSKKAEMDVQKVIERTYKINEISDETDHNL